MGKRNRWLGYLSWPNFMAGMFLSVALAAGCSSDERPPKLYGDKSSGEWCADYCRWQQACRNEPEESCVTSCRLSGGFEDYGRPEFYGAMGNCLAIHDDCQGGPDVSWEACFEEASLAVAPTQAAFDFCASMGTLFFECGFGMAPSTCARNFGHFNDETLSAIESCAAATCETYMDCIKTVAYGGQ